MSPTSKGVTVSISKTTAVGTAPGVLALGDGADGGTAVGDDTVLSTASVGYAGIKLGPGADVVKLAGMSKAVVLGSFGAASGVTIGGSFDKIDLSGLGLKLSNLTFTYFENATDTTGSDATVNSVKITAEGFDGAIYLVGGITTTNLTADNFIFG